MIAAVVLAAGFARRMGRAKLVLPLHGKPLVRWSVEAVLPHVDQVLVVVAAGDTAVRSALGDLPLRYTENPRPHEGQASSVAAGIAALPPWTSAALVVLGDQPRVPPEVVPALLAGWRRSARPIVVPVYRGMQGTPVLFAADVFPELVALTGDTGARPVVQARAERVEHVAFDIAMPADVDTPEDYARLHVQ